MVPRKVLLNLKLLGVEGAANVLSQSVVGIATLVIVVLAAALYRLSLRLGDALEHQVATSNVLKTTTRSFDLDQVLSTLILTSVGLAKADAAAIIRPTNSSENHVAELDLPDGYRQYLARVPLVPDRETLVGRTLLEGRTVLILDASTDANLKVSPEREFFRSWLGVPLMRDEKAIGIMVLARTFPRPAPPKKRAGNVNSRLYWSRDLPFSDRDVELVTMFAKQAVIAIENAGQFNEIQKQRRQLELANSFKARFLATASHDLRQPLHALNLFVAQLKTESADAERRHLVDQIHAAVDSMNDLFDALLDMSRLDADVLQPNSRPVSVQSLFERIETTFGETARKKGLRLRIVPTTAWVCSDGILLERMLHNLSSNAVRYTQTGGVLIGCRRNGSQLRIDVCDTGPGLAPNEQSEIFGEFYQLPGTRPNQSGGLGLGLSIVDRLGQLLGHCIDVQSQLGKGSRFSVSVPLAQPKTDAAMDSEQLDVSWPDQISGKLIVVIDDDALVLDGMRGILASWNCHFIAADTVESAQAQLRVEQRAPNLIISDFRLANGFTGIKAIEALQENYVMPIPALLMSGDTAADPLREAKDSGYLLLHKPISPMMLRTTLHRLLGGHIKVFDGTPQLLAESTMNARG